MLKWDLQFGPKIKELQALRDAGNVVPDLDRRPELNPADEWIWEGYAELGRGRNWSNGQPMYIALSDILAYSEFAQLSREDANTLLHFVRMLDDVYFEHLNKKARKEKARQDAKAKTRNGRTRSSHRRKTR